MYCEGVRCEAVRYSFSLLYTISYRIDCNMKPVSWTGSVTAAQFV